MTDQPPSAPQANSRLSDGPPAASQLPTRLVLGALGIAAIAFGAWQILSHPGTSHPLGLAKWLIGALLVHDAIIAPVVIGIGWLLARFVPARPRAFVQAGLVVAGLIASIGALLIWRQESTALHRWPCFGRTTWQMC